MSTSVRCAKLIVLGTGRSRAFVDNFYLMAQDLDGDPVYLLDEFLCTCALNSLSSATRMYSGVVVGTGAVPAWWRDVGQVPGSQADSLPDRSFRAVPPAGSA
jgi:hypothetical protein